MFFFKKLNSILEFCKKTTNSQEKQGTGRRLPLGCMLQASNRLNVVLAFLEKVAFKKTSLFNKRYLRSKSRCREVLEVVSK